MTLPPMVRFARAHDQAVAQDYFAAMQQVEQRLAVVPNPEQETKAEAVKVQPMYPGPAEPLPLFQLIERLEIPELCFEERFDIAMQLREAFSPVFERAP